MLIGLLSRSLSVGSGNDRAVSSYLIFLPFFILMAMQRATELDLQDAWRRFFLSEPQVEKNCSGGL
jgi:hypothetical protein